MRPQSRDITIKRWQCFSRKDVGFAGVELVFQSKLDL